jgi:rhodanese-related sulfurtransferase
MKQIAVQDLSAHCAAQPTLLLDVREPWEVSLASIQVPGTSALAIPMNELPARLQDLNPLQPVVCICHHGIRSAQVVAWLEQRGFDAVYNLAGGIAAWSQQVDPRVPSY